MNTTAKTRKAAAPEAGKLNKPGFALRFRKNWQLHMLMVLPLLYLLLFYYAPMFGLRMAFSDFDPKLGIMGSEWVGLKHFKELFGPSTEIWKLIKNTVYLSLYNVFVGFPLPIVLALMLHVSERKILKKLTQNVSYMPHFISTAVLVGILMQVLNPTFGAYGTIVKMFGGNPTNLMASEKTFAHLFVWSGIWQQVGWSTIIYVAALAGVSHELHEAAELDGASRWKRVLNVDLPAILPTICIMLILRFGQVMTVGYEKILIMRNPLNWDATEVISTFVYDNGIAQPVKGFKFMFSFSTAVDLFNSVVNTTLLVTVNAISKKLTNGEQGLF